MVHWILQNVFHWCRKWSRSFPSETSDLLWWIWNKMSRLSWQSTKLSKLVPKYSWKSWNVGLVMHFLSLWAMEHGWLYGEWFCGSLQSRFLINNDFCCIQTSCFFLRNILAQVRTSCTMSNQGDGTLRNSNEALYHALGGKKGDIGAELRRQLLFRNRILLLFNKPEFKELTTVRNCPRLRKVTFTELLATKRSCSS